LICKGDYPPQISSKKQISLEALRAVMVAKTNNDLNPSREISDHTITFCDGETCVIPLTPQKEHTTQ